MTSHPFPLPLAAVVAAACWAAPALAQDPTPQPATAVSPGGREAMWYAPTAADWQKPVLIPWQRTWDDAMALAKAERRPILVCVNMDGEIASEHYAGVRYRDPELAKLYAQYVCVVASVFRHNPRDHDEQGRRIPCPRFGCITCGEHMALEPLVYAKFLDGQRVAPRHIMVEVDGSKSFDVFYTYDIASVVQQISDGITKRTEQAVPAVKGDRSLLERVASKDQQDRQAVEQEFAAGDAAARQALLDAALALGEQAPLEVLRQALQGLDAAQAAAARRGLAKVNAPEAADLVGEALRAPLVPAEREPLLDALDRLAATSPRAQALAMVHRGLAGGAATVDAERWAKALAEQPASYAPAAEPPDIAQALAARDAALAKEPGSAEARLQLAEGSLAQASAPTTAERFRRVLLEDARTQARRAAELGAPAWRTDTVLALASKALGEVTEAYALAERAAAALPPEANAELAAAVLFLFAEARQEAIVAAHRKKERWPQAWFADVHSTYAVLAVHPFGTDAMVAHHVDFLQFFGGADAAGQALDRGLQRFPAAPLLHERLRQRVLREQGVEALQGTYRTFLQQHDLPTVRWFAAYADLVAAEHHRRRGRSAEALVAYGTASALFEAVRAQAPADAASCDHYVAMAHFGRSRIHYEDGDIQGAVAEVIAGFRRAPQATPVLDGLNLSGADTARMLVARLQKGDLPEQQKALQAAMDELDPDLLRLPDYERMGPGGGAPPPRRRRG